MKKLIQKLQQRLDDKLLSKKETNRITRLIINLKNPKQNVKTD